MAERRLIGLGIRPTKRTEIIDRLACQVLNGQLARDQFWRIAASELAAIGIILSRQRLELILHNVMSEAYGNKRDQEYANPLFRRDNPYIGWSTPLDIRMAPSHLALDFRLIKTVFPIDDPLWKIWREPLSNGCRCSRLSFSPRELATRGLTVGRLSDWIGKTKTIVGDDGRTFTAEITIERARREKDI